MSGLGAAAFGVAPYGVGTPATSSANGGAILPDTYGVTQGGRYINPRTRVYEFDAFGRSKGLLNVQQLVLLAMLTVRGSAAQTTLGVEAPSGVIGANFVSQRKTAITNALKALVDDNVIEIISIDVNVKNRPVFTLVRWRDLTTSLEHEDAL